MARRNRGGWWTKERQQRAYSVLREKAGLSDAGARGLVSRWANVEARQGPTAKNPFITRLRGAMRTLAMKYLR